MKFEVKNLKYSEWNSEDSNCFQATIYVDGRRAFLAQDQGFGGCIDFTPIDTVLYEAAEDYISGLPNEPTYDLRMDMELFVGELIEKELQRRDRMKAANRGIAYMKFEDDTEISWYCWPKGMRKTSANKAFIRAKWLPDLMKKHPGYLFINPDGTFIERCAK